MPRSAAPELPVTRKQLHRFNEPLVLLKALGTARGPHTEKKIPQVRDLESVSSRDRLRCFLDELAFNCEFKKGGGAVTAIALQQPRDAYGGVTFIVGANCGPNMKIVSFLRNLLSIIERGPSMDDEARLKRILSQCCITHNQSTIRDYAKLLKGGLEKLLDLSEACNEGGIYDGIKAWQLEIERIGLADHRGVITFAYDERHSSTCDVLHQLSERDSSAFTGQFRERCGKVRHYIGRLGRYLRSTDALCEHALYFKDLLASYNVLPVPPPPPGSGRPESRSGTTPLQALGRMLPANSPDKGGYEQAIRHLDDQGFDVSKRFKDDWDDPELATTVHAEAQVLHHFATKDVQFAGNDKYIACSKPACYCCELYFRYHPLKPHVPASHRKIYVTWQAPGVTEAGPPNLQLRKILNDMVVEIREDALQQLKAKAGPNKYHPDSVTGISAWTSIPVGGEARTFRRSPQGHPGSDGADSVVAGSDRSDGYSVSFDDDASVLETIPEMTAREGDSLVGEENGGVSLKEFSDLLKGSDYNL